MAVPSHVVWKSMLPLRKKLVLVAVCSMTVFMMICAIIRIGVGLKGKLTDLSWFLLWNSVEMTLCTFPTLLQNLAMFQRPDSPPCPHPPPSRHFDLSIISCISVKLAHFRLCQFPTNPKLSSNRCGMYSLVSQSLHPSKKHETLLRSSV